MINKDNVGNQIVRGHFAAYQEVGCMFHKKESRYRIKYYPEENLFIVECLECKPPTEIVRAKVQK